MVSLCEDARVQEARKRQERMLVGSGTLLVLAFAVWRVTTGADLADGTHVVALAMRMAQGDAPLSDEMNLQVLGSLPAVPFTWLWLQVAGVDGIVLASRLFYVLFALAVGWLAYRALRTGVPPVLAFLAVTLMLLATPYSLLVTSYNTGPVLGLGLATCAAFAALQRESGRWAALAGAALAFSVLSHPATLPPAALLAIILLVLAERGQVVRGLLTGGLAAVLLIVLAVPAGPGVGALADTVNFTTDYQADRISPWERLLRSVGMHAEGLFAWRNIPALLLAVTATVPAVPLRWRLTAATAAPVALAAAVIWASRQTPPGELLLGPVASAYLVLVTLLLTPAVVLAARDAADLRLRRLLALTLPPGLLGLVSLSLVSSASAKWGVAAAPVQPLLGVAVLTVLVLLARQRGRTVALVAGGAVLVSLLGVHTMRVFSDAQPWRLDARVADGPLAGLLTRESTVDEDCRMRTAVEGWVDPGDSVFFWSAAAGYAYSTARMDTPILWLADFGAANAVGVEWMTEHDRWPDVVFVHAGVLEAVGGWDEVVARDPILAAFDRDYGPPAEVPGYLVLRRDGTTRPVDPVGSCG